MTGVSGWFEGENSIISFHYDNVKNPLDLAVLLLNQFGKDCVGVDLEISGEYLDGVDAEDSIEKLFGVLT
tara:strand:- start:318 stop:527 length:210 start_codon:yes stop_codon:yes gene_type:complete